MWRSKSGIGRWPECPRARLRVHIGGAGSHGRTGRNYVDHRLGKRSVKCFGHRTSARALQGRCICCNQIRNRSERGSSSPQDHPHIGVRVFAVPADGRAHAEQVLGGRGEVDFVEPDVVARPQDNLPSDPSFPANYAVGGGAWGWTMTHTTQAWDITKGDSALVIAILDKAQR